MENLKGKKPTEDGVTTLLLERVVKYITSLCKIDTKELCSNTRIYVKEMLKSVRVNNNKLKYYANKRKKLREDISDLENTFVCGDSYGDGVIAKNTGLRQNNVELRHIKILELKEKLADLLLDQQLLEESLEENNQLVKDFIGLIKNENYQLVMIMTYIDCMTNGEIASTLLYSVNNIDAGRIRGTKILVSILKEYLEKN